MVHLWGVRALLWAQAAWPQPLCLCLGDSALPAQSSRRGRCWRGCHGQQRRFMFPPSQQSLWAGFHPLSVNLFNTPENTVKTILSLSGVYIWFKTSHYLASKTAPSHSVSLQTHSQRNSVLSWNIIFWVMFRGSDYWEARCYGLFLCLSRVMGQWTCPLNLYLMESWNTRKEAVDPVKLEKWPLEERLGGMSAW